MPARRRLAVLPLLIVLLSAAGALAACKGATQRSGTVTVSVTQTPTHTVQSTPHTSPQTTGQPNSHPDTLRAGRPMSHLPGECNGLLPTPAIVNVIGKKINGPTAFVVGLPDHSISRVSYINCRYGGTKTRPGIEIQVSLYTSDAKAAARIRPNTDDFVGHGAKATRTTVGGVPATLLIGAFGSGYPPTIIMALGQRTIAVSIEKDAVDPAKLTDDLKGLAFLAAQRTTH